MSDDNSRKITQGSSSPTGTDAFDLQILDNEIQTVNRSFFAIRHRIAGRLHWHARRPRRLLQLPNEILLRAVNGSVSSMSDEDLVGLALTCRQLHNIARQQLAYQSHQWLRFRLAIQRGDFFEMRICLERGADVNLQFSCPLRACPYDLFLSQDGSMIHRECGEIEGELSLGNLHGVARSAQRDNQLVAGHLYHLQNRSSWIHLSNEEEVATARHTPLGLALSLCTAKTQASTSDATADGDARVLRWLLKKGADPNVTTCNGWLLFDRSRTVQPPYFAQSSPLIQALTLLASPTIESNSEVLEQVVGDLLSHAASVDFAVCPAPHLMCTACQGFFDTGDAPATFSLCLSPSVSTHIAGLIVDALQQSQPSHNHPIIDDDESVDGFSASDWWLALLQASVEASHIEDHFRINDWQLCSSSPGDLEGWDNGWYQDVLLKRALRKNDMLLEKGVIDGEKRELWIDCVLISVWSSPMYSNDAQDIDPQLLEWRRRYWSADFLDVMWTREIWPVI